MYTYNRATSICIDLSKLKLFVFVIFFQKKNESSGGCRMGVCRICQGGRGGGPTFWG